MVLGRRQGLPLGLFRRRRTWERIRERRRQWPQLVGERKMSTRDDEDDDAEQRKTEQNPAGHKWPGPDPKSLEPKTAVTDSSVGDSNDSLNRYGKAHLTETAGIKGISAIRDKWVKDVRYWAPETDKFVPEWIPESETGTAVRRKKND